MTEMVKEKRSLQTATYLLIIFLRMTLYVTLYMCSHARLSIFLFDSFGKTWSASCRTSEMEQDGAAAGSLALRRALRSFRIGVGVSPITCGPT